MSIRARHGKVTATTIEVPFNAQSGATAQRMLQVNSSGAAQKAQLIRGSGEDFNPFPGEHAFLFEFDASYLAALATDNNNAPTVAQGERKIYAYDSSGTQLGYIYLKSDGKITIANQTENLLTALVNLITGILAMTTSNGGTMIDSSTLVGVAKSQLQGLLE